MEASIPHEVARQAAHWLMLLHGGEMDAHQMRACERWRAASAEHERAWQRARQVQERLGLLPPALAMGALGRERRQALKQLLVLASMVPLAGAGYTMVERRQWLADQRTLAGQRRVLTLEDGSRVYMNSDSAIDVRFDREQRLIRLRRGEILIESGSDSGAANPRPMRVATGQGILQPIGTRFSVRRLDERALTRLMVFEGAVRVQPEKGAAVIVTGGRQLSFAASGAGPQATVDEAQAGWTRGQLIVEEQSLDEFIGELARHRSGWLRCAPEVARLRISGTFQLDNTDAILAALPATLPVSIESHTRYWVTVRGR
ncbi:MAG: FecR domain-containing protein [Pseudomonas sp.]